MNTHIEIENKLRKLKPLLIDKLGGVDNFWAEMLQSAMHWFEPGEESAEFENFFYHLFIAGGMSAGTEYAEKIGETSKAFHEWQNSAGGD